MKWWPRHRTDPVRPSQPDPARTLQEVGARVARQASRVRRQADALLELIDREGTSNG